MLQLIADNKVVDIKRIQYSDGAVGFDLGDFPINTKSVVISIDPTFKVSGLLDELTQLMWTLSEVKNVFDKTFSISLYVPYLPYARNDRKFSFSGNFGLEIFIRSVSDLGVNKLITVDPHNPDAFESWCNVHRMKADYTTQLQAFIQTMQREHISPQKEWDVVIAPDKGARDKAAAIANCYNIPLICCTKERDVSTGKLSNPVVPERVDGLNCLIVDDLLDYGGTYIQLAQELYKQGATFIDLYVTHLIAAKGLSVLTNSINKVYTYQTCCGYVTMQDVQKFNKGE